MGGQKGITITVGQITIKAQLNDSASAESIYNALPIEASANTWGDEVYFSIPVSLDSSEDAREDMEIGELGYWPAGSGFCIFFGSTPASDSSGKPRAASAVNPIGKVIGDATVLKAAVDGDKVTISAAD